MEFFDAGTMQAGGGFTDGVLERHERAGFSSHATIISRYM